MVTSHRTTRPKTKFGLFLAMALLLVFASSAQAVLFRVGPTQAPSPPGGGFPLWYQDTNGTAMDLCIPRNDAQLNSGICLILPPPDPEGINLPIVFPGNYPGEAFYWNATGVMDLPGNNNQATMVLALEAAFAAEVPIAGDQVVFGRVRTIIDAPVDGTYTVTHPYGVETFANVVAGPRAITATSDIGIGAPGDFTGALRSGVGPFLKAAAAPGGAALLPVTVPGDPTGDRFLADPGTLTPITGSPLNTNFFEVCVDAPGGLDGAGTACQRLNQFALMGKVHTDPIPSPFVVNSATYSRDALGAQVDVTATASAGPGALPPRLFFGDAATTNLIPSTLMNGPTALGQFFGQAIPANPATLPASIIVTNSADVPPASITQALVDVVTVTQAAYNPATGALTITAATSDEVTPPQMIAIGLPGAGANVDVPLVPTANPAVHRLVFNLPAVGGLRVPPPSVTVTSAKGGRGTATVTTVAAAPGTFPAGGPIAVNDRISVPVGDTRARVSIPVFRNDTNGPVPSTIRIVTRPTKGTIRFAQPGRVIYTFTGAKAVGTDTFSYTVSNAAGAAGIRSNVATVTVRIVP